MGNNLDIENEVSGYEGNAKVSNTGSGRLIQLVVFKVDEELYGLEITKIQEIIRLPDITRLPKASSFIKGVINLRGNIVPVIDLREKFGLNPKIYNKLTRAIVVDVNDKRLALIVDEVANVLRMDESQILEAPMLVSGIAKEYIEGVAKHDDNLVILLKIDKILTSDDIIEIEKVGQE
jgi:purine-binding chemotaxis protein CheW